MTRDALSDVAALRQQLVDATRRAESLRRVIESISGELALEPLLTRIVESAAALIGAMYGSIGLVVETTTGPIVRVATIYNMPPHELGAEIPAGVGLAGRVLLEQRSLWLDRYGDLQQPTLPELADHAVIGVPIWWAGRMIGFFGIGTEPPRRFNRQDSETLELFARHAAIAIENARLFEAERRRAVRIATINRIGRLITGSLSLKEVFQTAVEAIHVDLDFTYVAAGLVDAVHPDTLVLYAHAGLAAGSIPDDYHHSIHEGIVGAAARSRHHVLINDVRRDARYIPLLGNSRIYAELAIPIMLNNHLLGVLNIESERRITEHDVEGVEIVADQLAVAIENAQLFAATQRALEETRRFSETRRQLAVLEERQRLARDLHDSVTQLIFSMTLLAQSITPAFRRDPAEGEQRVARLVEISRRALAEMRALLVELRPAEADQASASAGIGANQSDQMASGSVQVREHGLVAALRRHIAALEHDAIMIELDTTGYVPQPYALEEALYRIAQEALSNVVKHACARHVVVRLHGEGARTRLTVKDDGVGFVLTPGASRARMDGGFGLTTMRERAEIRGGTVEIRSAPGSGTTIDVIVPHTHEEVR